MNQSINSKGVYRTPGLLITCQVKCMYIIRLYRDLKILICSCWNKNVGQMYIRPGRSPKISAKSNFFMMNSVEK